MQFNLNRRWPETKWRQTSFLIYLSIANTYYFREKKMKRSAIFFVLLFTWACGKSQDKAFKTYEQYVNNTGKEIGKFVWADETYNKVKVIFEDPAGGKLRYSAKEIWGFTYEGQLYRSTGTQFGKLQDSGTVCLYVNGVGAISPSGRYAVNWSDYLVSVGGMGGKLYGLTAGNGSRKDLPALKKDHPELEELYTCVKNKYQELVPRCVKIYNKSH
jgi:hypothetical protein